MLEARAPFRDVLMWRTFADGARRYVSVSGEPMFDAQGPLRRLSRHRPRRHQAEAHPAAPQARPRGHPAPGRGRERARGPARRAAGRVRHACLGLLGAVDARRGRAACCGAPRTGRRRTRRARSASSRPRQSVTFRPGEGLVGAVWQSGEPIWVPDSQADARARRTAARARNPVCTPRCCSRSTPARASRRCSNSPRGACASPTSACGRRWARSARRSASSSAAPRPSARCARAKRASAPSPISLPTGTGSSTREYRFTRIEGRNVAGGDPGLQRRLIGSARWDTGLEIEGGWDAHRAMLEARQPFHDLLMWRPMADGRVRYMRVSGEALLNPDGSFAGYRGVGRDVTGEKRAEQMLRLEHEVARLLAAAEDSAAGLKAVMRAVCEGRGLRLRPLLPRRRRAAALPGRLGDRRSRRSRRSSSARAASCSAPAKA